MWLSLALLALTAVTLIAWRRQTTSLQRRIAELDQRFGDSGDARRELKQEHAAAKSSSTA